MSSNGEESQLAVPKFSSFKSSKEEEYSTSVPKFASFRSAEKDDSSSAHQPRHPKRSRQDTKTRSRSHERHSKRHDDRHSRSKRSHERSSNERAERYRSPSPQRSPKTRQRRERRERSGSPRRKTEPEPGSRNFELRHSKDIKSDSFIVDTDGDPFIIRYGGIERSKIPNYRRSGAGRVLGTIGRLSIHREGARDQFSLRMPGEGVFQHQDGLRTRSSRAKQEPVLLRPRKAHGSDDGDDEGYLALAAPKKSRRSDSSSESSDVDMQPDYRTIELSAKRNTLSDSDSTSESEGEDGMIDIERTNPIRWRSIQLNRRVKDNLKDIDSWIELVDHQDTLMKAGESPDYQALENEVHSFTEIKVSMLESALPHASKPEHRKKVLVYLMREGVKIWSNKTARKKWDEVLKDESGDFDLWKMHLDYEMSNISTFRLENIKKILLDRKRELLCRNETEPSQGLFHEAIYLFLRLTRLIHDVGFMELAVAAWQAMLELTFFRPSAQTNIPDRAFQEFWESEVPRIGEDGSEGWAKYLISGGDAPEPLVNVPSEITPTRDLYKEWAQRELFQAQKSKQPARTMDEDTEEDPFRVVMYSDVEPLIFWIPGELLPHVAGQLVNAFLIFSGLLPFSRCDEWTEMAFRDQFLTGAKPPLQTKLSSKSLQEGLQEISDRPKPNFQTHFSSVVDTPDMLFAREDWYFYFGRGTEDAKLNLKRVDNTIGRLVHSIGMDNMDNLAEYYLALRASSESGDVKKLAKILLKQWPTKMSLYNAYALAEYARGHLEIAVKVLGSAVFLSSPANPHDCLPLWNTWAWIELEAGHKTVALKRLCASVDETLRGVQDDEADLSATSILKTQQSLSTNFGCLVATGNLDSACMAAQGLALLSYLTTNEKVEPSSKSQGNISAAMETVASTSNEFRARGYTDSASHERLVQFAAKLLFFHASRGPYRRTFIKGELIKFIKDFPQNSILLSLIEWTDSNLRVVDETRELLYDRVLLKPHDTLSSRTFAIEHELSRGNVNTVKAAFEQAVRSDVGRCSVPIWISYVRFCWENKELLRKKVAKEVFYRALRQCPWSKDLMMEGFGGLVGDMGSEELKALFNTMTDKGLRVHVDLDEFLDSRRSRGAG